MVLTSVDRDGRLRQQCVVLCYILGARGVGYVSLFSKSKQTVTLTNYTCSCLSVISKSKQTITLTNRKCKASYIRRTRSYLSTHGCLHGELCYALTFFLCL